MSMEDFYTYLNIYREEYYEKYIQGLNDIGDYFVGFSSDYELRKWLQNMSLNPQPLQNTGNRSVQFSGIPPYAEALQRLFHKDYTYSDERYSQGELGRVTNLEAELAAIVHSGRSTIASWKSGMRVPNKYKWWALGIAFFKLSYWDVQPYLDMIGSRADMRCLDDILLFYSISTSKSVHDVYCLLLEYGCEYNAELFKP